MNLSYPRFLRWAARLIVTASKNASIFGILGCHVGFGAICAVPVLFFVLAENIAFAEAPLKIAAVVSILLVSLPLFPVLMLTTLLFADSLFTLVGVYRWLSISPYALLSAVEKWSYR
jgi:hypothetical protein